MPPTPPGMTRPRSPSSNRPLPVQLALGLFRSCASLKLAVVLIAACVIVLAWATIVESYLGDASKPAHYGFYRTWWFFALNALLGLNVLCAALDRFPWKQYLAGLLGSFPGRLILGSFVVMLWLSSALVAWSSLQHRLAPQFGPGAMWWFSVFGACLAGSLIALAVANVLYAMAVHLWWKRRQAGFLITHVGILVLLLGSLLTYCGGIDAQLAVFEGEAQWRAVQDSQSLKLAIFAEDEKGSPEESADPVRSAEADSASEPKEIRIPFVAGPFNWGDYRRMSPFPWWLARRDRGVIYDRRGIKLEVLDYYSDSEEMAIPRIRLQVYPGSSPSRSLSDRPGESVELAVERSPGLRGAGRRDLSTGQSLAFWMAASEAETRAFRNSGPQGPLGPRGQIVLHAGGREFRLPVDSFQQQPRQPLGKTGLEVELAESIPRPVAVLLLIHHGQDPPQRMVLLADFPERNFHDQQNGVFGSYWFDPAEQRTDDGDQPEDAGTPGNAPRPRIDILQGADGKLYYRTWRAPTVGTIAQMPADGTEVAAFEGTPDAVTVSVEELIASPKPQIKVLPLAFDGHKNPAAKQRRVRLRLSVDGTRQEFWLAGLPPGRSDAAAFPPAYRRVFQGNGRRVVVSMPYDEIDLGFQVYLRKFSRKLDPGTSAVSHYSSLVDFCDRHDRGKQLQKDVLITLNAPVNYSDPRSGRSYRLYQSSFWGPFRPGDAEFRERVGGKQRRDRLFQSILSVNYDPGRGLKYLGCLMISAGILLTYYVRFRSYPRRARPKPQGPQNGFA